MAIIGFIVILMAGLWSIFNGLALNYVNYAFSGKLAIRYTWFWVVGGGILVAFAVTHCPFTITMSP